MGRPIRYGDMLARLPLDVLPAPLRDAATQALRSDDDNACREQLHLAIPELLDRGRLRILRSEETLSGRLVRYQLLGRDGLEEFSLLWPLLEERSSRERDDWVYRRPLPLRDWDGTSSLGQFSALIELSEKVLPDVRGDAARRRNEATLSRAAEIIRLLVSQTQAVLDCDRVSFWSGMDAGVDASPLDPIDSPPPTGWLEWVARHWVLDQNQIVYYANLGDEAGEGEVDFSPSFDSLAMVPVGSRDGVIHGVLMAWSRPRGFFDARRLGLLSVASQVGTNLLRYAQTLQDLEYADRQLGIHNRQYLEEEARRQIARADRTTSRGEVAPSFVLVIIDVDRFKSFNTQCGYEGGNDVLQFLADTLRREFRMTDIVARYGGDEFGIVLDAATEENARPVCERVRAKIAESTITVRTLRGTADARRFTVSMGGAVFPQNADSWDALFSRADEALKAAKQGGGNRVVFYSDLQGRAGGE